VTTRLELADDVPLVSGDRVAGPVRTPRRSERYPSLVRVDTINGTPADEVTAGTRYEDMPCALPAERLALGGDDPTVHAIEWLTPFGKGSRVAVTGPARAGKTQALRRIGAALAAQAGDGEGGLQVSLVLAGVRPEEIADWEDGGPAPAAATALGASPDSQAQAFERVVEQARRVAARGRDAVVLVDGLDGLTAPAARKVLASARNLVDAGSLTIVATATEPVGGETTVIALNRELTSTARFPAVDLVASGLNPKFKLKIKNSKDDDDLTDGVLHVTAQVASCDAEAEAEHPACYLARQDWGVPVRLTVDGPAEVRLMLNG